MTPIEAVAELRSRVCGACNGPKQEGLAFCGVCYHWLPKARQHALWHRIGNGFEQAYADAKTWLKEKWSKSL